MLKSTNGTNGTHSPQPHGTRLLMYAINDLRIVLYTTGEMEIGDLLLDQHAAFAISTALKMPGLRAQLNRMELERQRGQVLEGD